MSLLGPILMPNKPFGEFDLILELIISAPELLNAIQEEKQSLKSDIPIAVKISPDIEEINIESIAELLLKYNIAAAIISNTTDRNRENLKNINKLEKGGLSGKPLEKKI